jgi:hypothetical protein
MGLFDRISRNLGGRSIDSDTFFRSINDPPLSNIGVDEPGKSVYRFAIRRGLDDDITLWSQFIRDSPLLTPIHISPPVWIEVTEVGNSLTVLVRTTYLGAKIQETINIDRLDYLFREELQSLKENIDKLDFWSMVSSRQVGVDGWNGRLYGCTVYMTEIAHSGKYHWLISSEGFGGLYPLSLPHISSMAAVQDRQVRIQEARTAQAIQAIRSDHTFQAKLKELVEAAKEDIEIYHMLQAKKKEIAETVQEYKSAQAATQEIKSTQADRSKIEESLLKLIPLYKELELLVLKFEELMLKQMEPIEVKLQGLLLKQIHLIEALEIQKTQEAQVIQAELQILKSELIA